MEISANVSISCYIFGWLTIMRFTKINKSWLDKIFTQFLVIKLAGNVKLLFYSRLRVITIFIKKNIDNNNEKGRKVISQSFLF